MKKIFLLLLIVFTIQPIKIIAQTRQVNHHTQSWISSNNKIDIHKKWSVLADFHIRRNGFFSTANFYFARTGVAYNFNRHLYVAIGYAHMWLAPTTPGWKTYTQEDRLYQQWQYSSSVKKITILQRLRNEQRWVQKIVEDKYSGEKRFTDRIRYLLSITIPVFNNEKLPALVVSDELHLQLGKEVVYNPFEQNRYFIGIKQNISSGWSFDMGYMKLYQQKYSGYQYDSNDTFRLFFYYTGAWHKKNN